jgi:hypothetical protein
MEALIFTRPCRKAFMEPLGFEDPGAFFIDGLDRRDHTVPRTGGSMTYYILSGKYKSSKEAGAYVASTYDIDIAERNANPLVYPLIKNKTLRVVFGILLALAFVFAGTFIAGFALDSIKKIANLRSAAQTAILAAVSAVIMAASTVAAVKICGAIAKKGKTESNRVFLISDSTSEIQRKVSEMQDPRTPLQKAMDGYKSR